MEREAFLARVRASTGGGPPVALQPAGEPPSSLPTSQQPDAVAAMAGWWHRPSRSWQRVAAGDAASSVVAILRGHGLRRIALSGHPLLAALGVPRALSEVGEVLPSPAEPRDLHATLASADVGITVADVAVAETGTLVERAGPDQPRAISLLPPVHIALLPAAAILPSLDDLFALLAREPVGSGITLISGPSGTADIGLQHVTGVHGPGQVHLVVVEDAGQRA